jgi:hypothetical protein
MINLVKSFYLGDGKLSRRELCFFVLNYYIRDNYELEGVEGVFDVTRKVINYVFD